PRDRIERREGLSRRDDRFDRRRRAVLRRKPRHRPGGRGADDRAWILQPGDRALSQRGRARAADERAGRKAWRPGSRTGGERDVIASFTESEKQARIIADFPILAKRT